jgi:two-component system, cell cycle sensor histidine kinase and response regulator CckA
MPSRHPSVLEKEQQNIKPAETANGQDTVCKVLLVQLNLAHVLNNTYDLKEGLALCLDAAIEVSELDCGGIYLFDEGTADLKMIVHKGLSREFVDKTSIYTPDSENVKLILKGESFYANYQKREEPFDQIAKEDNIHAVAVLPIRHKNKVIGCMNVGSHAVDRISDTSRISLEMIATQLGSAISRLESEMALRESEERYRIAIEHSIDGIVLSEKGRYFFANAVFLKIFGYERADEIIGKNITTTVHPDDKERVWRIYNLRVQGKEVPEMYEFKGIRKDGAPNHIEITATKILYNGRTLILAYFRDITEKKKAEQTLNEAQERYAALYDRSFDGVYLHDFEGNYLDGNKALTGLTGYSREEFASLKFSDLISPDQFLLAAESTDAIVRQGSEKQVRTYQIRTKDSELREVETRGALIYRNGKPYAIQGIVRDVTDQKKAEKALKESELKFRSLFDDSPHPFAITSLKDGKVMDVNNRFCELTGYAKDELIGKGTVEHGFYTQQDRNRVLDQLREFGKIEGFELNYRAKDKKIINCLLSAATINLNDEPFILSMYVDVTDLKRLESQLRQSQKMESVGTLAGGIAHDFNNILGIILGNAEMAKLCINGGNLADHPVEYNIDQIIEASLRARQVIRQLLDFSRQGRQTKFSLIISPLIKESLKLLRSLIPANIDIRQSYKDDASKALVDPTQIHQVIINLCTNASAAMSERGGVIDVAHDTVVVNENETNRDHYGNPEPGRYIRLRIRDTGDGIAPEDLDRIFDPYFTTKGIGVGTGLGLSVVHGIVNDLKGAITVSSEPRKGTTFTILFPVADTDIKEDVIYENTEVPVGNERVLLIDDEPHLGGIAKEMLKNLGYCALHVESGAEALKMFGSDPHQFDLVVTDMAMPGMTGPDLAGEISRIRPDMPMILCTGHNKNMDEEKALKMGFKAFLIKPVTMTALAGAVREVLDKK